MTKKLQNIFARSRSSLYVKRLSAVRRIFVVFNEKRKQSQFICKKSELCDFIFIYLCLSELLKGLLPFSWFVHSSHRCKTSHVSRTVWGESGCLSNKDNGWTPKSAALKIQLNSIIPKFITVLPAGRCSVSAHPAGGSLTARTAPELSAWRSVSIL